MYQFFAKQTTQSNLTLVNQLYPLVAHKGTDRKTLKTVYFMKHGEFRKLECAFVPEMQTAVKRIGHRIARYPSVKNFYVVAVALLKVGAAFATFLSGRLRYENQIVRIY